MDKALDFISEYAEKGMVLRGRFLEVQAGNIRESALKTAISIARGGKLLLCGNGGSAADAQHVAGEFVNRFLVDRPALPALALTTDTSAITAIGNDLSFDRIFARQVEALGNSGDVLLAISTSGNSANVFEAARVARSKKIAVIGLTGPGGGKLAEMCDILIDTPGGHTPLIQELHMAFEHIFCYLVDYFLFENVGEIAPYLGQKKVGEV